nr:MAG TPA: hypothetical protein [Caudoviricetes sp.]
MNERLIGEEVRLKRVKIIVSMSLRMALILITLLLEKVLVVNVAMGD